MRKQLTAIIITLLMVLSATAQDQKVTSLTPTSTVSSSDIFYTVINPATSPASRKITLLNLFASGNGFRSLKDYGPDGTARHVEDAAISNGSTTLTSATASFSAADSGHTVSVTGAGAAGVPLITTISTITNSTTVVLAASASTTVSAKRCIIGKDNTNQFVTAMAAMSGKTLYVPPGKYVVKMTATSGGAVTIASNTTLIGEGVGSVVYIIGSDGKATGNADDDGKAAFYIAGGSSKIAIEGLHFIGQNGTGAAYTEPAQNQSNVISMGVASTTKDVDIRNCFFEQLFGFSIHNGGNSERINVIGNTTIECANGINVNADYSVTAYNRIYKSEGIENSGAYITVANNIFESCSNAAGLTTSLSIGGRTSVGDFGPGVVVVGNTFNNDAGGCISFNDGTKDALIIGNTLRGWQGANSQPGINITWGLFNKPQHIRIIGNTITNGTNHGIDVGGASISDITISDNEIYGTTYGIVLLSSGARLINNTLQGTLHDLAPAPGTYVRNNKFSSPANIDYASVAGASFTADSDLLGPAVASAATITASSGIFHVTGTTGISAISSTSVPIGTTITIIFDGVLTITHGSALKLAGSVNFNTTADTRMQFSWDGSAWREIGRVQP